MLLEKELKKLFHQINSREVVQITMDGFDITIRSLNDGSTLSLTTPVYSGGNYIPGSVRKSILHKAPFSSALMHTSLTIDEENYQISLNCLDSADGLSTQKFIDLLEEFSYAANEWHLYLDDHDKNDLVYVTANKR